ncbi:MAG TPA: hypothetical protein VFB38_13245 [Chthonomonadaceae bacterium]|nr:hypothetical protein [Chthonomonadaceae bacterium]
MFWLLMKIRLLSARNVVRDSLRRHPLLVTGLSLLGIGLFVLAYLVVFFVFAFAHDRNVLPETLYQVFYFLFLFLLAGAVPFVASTLLHSTDYTLLFSAPLPPRAVIAAKLLDATVTNSLQFTVIGLPAIVAGATVLGLPLLGWLLLPLLIGLFVLVPALLTALALLLALAVLGVQRLRSAITVLNAVMAAVICITIVLEAGHLPLRPGMLDASLTSLTTSSATAHHAPSSWFATALLAMARADLTGTLQAAGAFLGSGLVVFALFVGCLTLGERLLSAANVADEDSGGRALPAEAVHAEPTGWHRLFSMPVAAILLKDCKYLWRDSILLSQLAMPMILFLVPFLLLMQDTSSPLRDEMFGFAAAMTGVILFMQTSILSLSLIGMESRSFWLILTSPNTGSTPIWAKFILSSLVSCGIGVTLLLISALIFGVSAQSLLFILGLVLLCSMALCGLGVGISAALPRFIYDNPAHRVSAWALILGFFGSVGYLTATAILFLGAWLLALRLDGGQHARMIYSLSMTIFLALTGFVTFVPMVIGARRLEVYQWEH